MKIMTLLLLLLLPVQILDAATAMVTRVNGKRIELDIGADRGMEVGVMADVFKEADRIIHPITGEDYGTRRVKIARIEIVKVNAEMAVGQVLTQWAPIQVGDAVEGLDVMPTDEENMQAEIDEARGEIKALARNLADEIRSNQEAIGDLRKTLRRIGSSERRLNSLLNGVQNIRERMVTIENRVQSLEVQQMEMIAQDTAEVNMLSSLEIKELGVLQKGEGDEVYLQVGNKLFKLAFEENRIVETTTTRVSQTVAGETSESMAQELVDDLFVDEEASEEEETPWYMSWPIFVGVGVVGLLGAAVVLFLKKGKQGGGEEDEGADGEIDIGGGFPEAEVGAVEDMEEMISEDLPELEEVAAEDEEKQ